MIAPEIAAADRYRLVATGLRMGFGDRHLFADAGLEVEPGFLTAVTGASGSGKTTLLMILTGFLPPLAGEVELVTGGLNESDGAGGSDRERGASRRTEARVGFVPQTFGLTSHLTAAENIGLPLQARRVSSVDTAQAVEASLADVGLSGLAGRMASELSGGQRQRVAVARALALGPHVLLADEATTELDPESRALVLGRLEAEARRGCAVLLATHDPEVVEMCDRRYRIIDERLVPD